MQGLNTVTREQEPRSFDCARGRHERRQYLLSVMSSWKRGGAARERARERDNPNQNFLHRRFPTHHRSSLPPIHLEILREKRFCGPKISTKHRSGHGHSREGGAENSDHKATKQDARQRKQQRR